MAESCVHGSAARQVVSLKGRLVVRCWACRSASEASGPRPKPDPRDVSSGRDGASAADLGGRP